MIISNFNIIRTGFSPFETDSELIIYSDTELAFPFSRQGFQPVSRWHTKFIKGQDGIKLVEFSCSCFPDHLRADPQCGFSYLAVKNILCAFVLEGLYHGIMISRIPCYVNRNNPHIIGAQRAAQPRRFLASAEVARLGAVKPYH